jgi:uncharacterized membrane protein
MPRELASIIIAASAWRWVVLALAVLLVPLAVVAARPGRGTKSTTAVALALRTLGIGLLLLCLLDPQLTTPQAKPGANFLAVLADNSNSLTIKDAGATQTRGEQVRTALTGMDSHWLASLAAQYQLRPYIFDNELRRVRDFTELDFTGERTALGAALSEVRERLAGQPLAGILLFTDGDATDLATTLPDLSGLPPIYPVLVGKADGLRDIRLAHVDVRQTAFDDAPVSVRAEIAGQGVGLQDVQVSVQPLNSPPLKAGEADPTPKPQTLRLVSDGQNVETNFDWHPAGIGAQFFNVSVTPPAGKTVDEATTANNHRIFMVDRGRPAYRILYVAGRPNWEFKFLNRALTDDPQLKMDGLIRIAKREPKFDFIGRNDTSNPLFNGFDAGDDTQLYDQPVVRIVYADVSNQNELRAGFPRNATDLFAYDAVIIDKVEAAFFTTDQLAMLRRFTAERGGGLLLLGGADTMEAGGYINTPLANALPVYLDRKAATTPQGELAWNLTREGWLEPWTRVRATETDERARLNNMPRFLVANALNGIKPGATVLATVTDSAGKVFPALVAQNYGAGRVACVAVGDMWLWGMKGDTEMADLSHFWRQLARWLVTNVPAPVELKIETAADGHSVTLRVNAHDQDYRPLDLGTASVKISRVSASNSTGASAFSEVTLPAEPVPDVPGQFSATFTPRDAGAYLAEADVVDRSGKNLGHAQSGWVNDPAIEEFQSLAPNRPLMEEIARRTGGQVIEWSQLDELAKMLPQRFAPITEQTSQPWWHQSGMFLAVLLCFLAEWGWRRWKGLP